MIGFKLVSLFVPMEPSSFDINTPSGTWHFEQDQHYQSYKKEFCLGKIGETYSIEYELPKGDNRKAYKKAAFDELLSICLAASFLTKEAVTPRRSLPFSEISFIQVGEYFPRERSMGDPIYAANTQSEFISFIECFVREYPRLIKDESIILLTHHWIDSMACWSLEDLYLSITTLLQVIAATEEKLNNQKYFASQFSGAVASKAIQDLPNYVGKDKKGDNIKRYYFIDMRNDLIHEGKLSGSMFPNKSKFDCAKVVADVLNWIDAYYFAILGLPKPYVDRYKADDFCGLNSFSNPLL